jgi:competence protein ComEC
MRSIVTRFRAFQLGTPGSSFSYFADGHFTLIEGRLTDLSRITLKQEMDICGAQFADVLHITSWDMDHCSASELPDLLKLVRPLRIECPGYAPHSDTGKACLRLISAYTAERREDNRTKQIVRITPEYIYSLQHAEDLAFKDTLYNPLHIDEGCPNNNSTAKHFRKGSFNLLSLGDIECSNISARLRRNTILRRETDIMILAHHGADNGFTNKKLINHLEPSLAICTSDYSNQYDHPRQEIRDLLYEHSVRLMTTKTGDVIVYSTGDHTGNYRAVNLKAESTGISSTCNFVSKKKRLLSFNDDTLRNIYNGASFWRGLGGR